MGLEAVGLAPDARTENEGRDERGDAGADMDDGAPGEVDGAEVAEPAAFTPDPMSDRRVDQERPQQREEDESLELLPFGEGTRDESRRDDGEHHLEGHVGRARDGGRVLCQRSGTDAAEADVVEPADDAPAVDVLAERQGEAEENPRNADESQDEDAVHDRAEDVLATDEAAVEERQPGRHQHDERGRGQDPGGVAGVDGGGGGHGISFSLRLLRGDRAAWAVRAGRSLGGKAAGVSTARVDVQWRRGGAPVPVRDGYRRALAGIPGG